MKQKGFLLHEKVTFLYIAGYFWRNPAGNTKELKIQESFLSIVDAQKLPLFDFQVLWAVSPGWTEQCHLSLDLLQFLST